MTTGRWMEAILLLAGLDPEWAGLLECIECLEGNRQNGLNCQRSLCKDVNLRSMYSRQLRIRFSAGTEARPTELLPQDTFSIIMCIQEIVSTLSLNSPELTGLARCRYFLRILGALSFPPLHWIHGGCTHAPPDRHSSMFFVCTQNVVNWCCSPSNAARPSILIWGEPEARPWVGLNAWKWQKMCK